MEAKNTKITDIPVAVIPDRRYVPGTELPDGAFVQSAGIAPNDTAVALRCDKEGQVVVSQDMRNCVAQMLTNQIVIMNALDSLLRREMQPAILGHLQNCVRASGGVQQPLLEKAPAPAA